MRITRLHPQSSKIIEERGLTFHPHVRWSQPFSVFDFNHLQLNAFCVISDSWTLAEEANYFKFPAVYVRTNTERPEAMDEGNFILTSGTTAEFLQAMELALDMAEHGDVGENVPDYADESVSTKVIKIIQSYTGIIKKVWNY